MKFTKSEVWKLNTAKFPCLE